MQGGIQMTSPRMARRAGRRGALQRHGRGPVRALVRRPAGDLPERDGRGGGRRRRAQLLGVALEPAGPRLSPPARPGPELGAPWQSLKAPPRLPWKPTTSLA